MDCKLFIWFLLAPLSGFAQERPYFQQEVNYRIDAVLDDTSHQLLVSAQIDYLNRSPDTLYELFFHLWANAFGDKRSAFAEQQLRLGDPGFYLAGEETLGGYRDLQFSSGNERIDWNYFDVHRDIAVLPLPRPLPPGDSVTLRTSYWLKVPEVFSRLGHDGQSYQITQWYPKPAVYDREGWRPMPYLDMGEFYAEFGSYEVSITLPADYVVGATGTLTTPAEEAFLEKKAAETRAWLAAGAIAPNPASGPEQRMKVVRYQAERVHDFAWFADRSFRVLDDRLTLPSGRQVDIRALFHDEDAWLWEDATTYAGRAVHFFSELVGEYPYPQFTVVQGPLGAGAGMEYPMITIIGEVANPLSLEEVIVHEAGHNWFQGVLAFNEREHPWLDEGINSYYEKRYMHERYPEDGPRGFPAFFRGRSTLEFGEAVYVDQARKGRDQAPATPADRFSELNYWLSVYEKSALAFRHLEYYRGREAFDRDMRAFYRDWQFRHPDPDALRQHLTRSVGTDLSWFFDGYLGSNRRLDFQIVDTERAGDTLKVRLRNDSGIPAPFPLAWSAGPDTVTRWVGGFTGDTLLALTGAGTAREVIIDPGQVILDVNRKNNRIRTRGGFRRTEPLALQWLTRLEDPRFTQLFWTPVAAWNRYDGWLPGLLLHNIGYPEKGFEWALAPMYAPETRQLKGAGGLHLRTYPEEGPFQTIGFHVQGEGFAFAENTDLGYQQDYYRLAPRIEVTFRTVPWKSQRHRLSWKSVTLWRDFPFFLGGEFREMNRRRDRFQSLTYMLDNRSGWRPSELEVRLEFSNLELFVGNEEFVKLSVDHRNTVPYRGDRKVYWRFFGGVFVHRSVDPGLNLLPNAWNAVGLGSNDYRFADWYFGRTDQEGIWSQQVHIRDGGFKNAFAPGRRIGRSNTWLVALNLKADLPFRLPWNLPLRPYLDLALYDAGPNDPNLSLDDPLLWSGGLALELIRDRLGVYLPLAHSKNIRDTYADMGVGLGGKLSFVIDLGLFGELRK